jgi:hypothetical protein
MAFIGNSMWNQSNNPVGTGHLVANNFATSNANAKPVGNTNQISDSFIGSPLAVSANSPPAGPLENSMQMAGAKEGWRESTTLGKAALLASTAAVFALTLPKNKSVGGYLRSSAFAGGNFYVLNAIFDKLR